MGEYRNLTNKALWIEERLAEAGDDIMDVLLGNITKPRSFVDAVTSLAAEYDREYDARVSPIGMGSSGTSRSGQFCYNY